MKNYLRILCFLVLNSMVSAQTCLPDGITLKSQQDVNNFAVLYPNCTEILGRLNLNGTSNGGTNITDLSPLSKLTSIGGLSMDYNRLLANLNGLENLKIINGDVFLIDNINLQNINHLSNVDTVNGFLTIADNDKLLNIDAFSKLKQLNGGIQIRWNDKLENLNGLINIQKINGSIYIGQNEALKSLSGLKNIDPSGVKSDNNIFFKDFVISYNPKLSVCAEPNICNILNTPGLTYEIRDNKSGCNTAEEILQVCSTLPPSCASLIYPNDTIEVVPVNAILHWKHAYNANKYLLSIGTSSQNYEILSNFNVGDTTSFQLADIPCDQRLFFKITPYNNNLPSENCIEYSTKTESTNAEAGENKIICLGDTLQLSAELSIGTDFLWQTKNSMSDSTSVRPFVFPKDSTSYILEVSNSGRCPVYDTVTVKLFPNPIKSLNVVHESGLNFNDGSIKLTLNGPDSLFHLRWSTGDSISLLTMLSPGLYSYIVKDSNNCISLDTFIINKYICPEIKVSSELIHPSCFGMCNGSIQLSINGGTHPYTLNWSNALADTLIVNLCGETYEVNINDSKNCNQTEKFTLVEPQILTSLLDSIKNVTCHGLCDGLIKVNSSGGVGMHVYEWSNGSINSNNDELCPGEFILIVTDENQCKHQDTFSIIEPENITITLDSIVNIIDSGFGSINITGSKNLTYSWFGPNNFNSNSEDLYNLQNEGVYSLMATDTISFCIKDTLFYVSGISNLNQASDIRLINFYPNPSYAGDLIIDIPDYDNHVYSYSIQSASGVIVNKGLLNQKVSDLSLDISSGVYFVSLIQEGKLINTQKWIVIR
ncbi:MAG: T9SS type A sorting domain-containing protein [Saprospiraceae bacterium]|nr:T9SS type A sorting domain-containing protein [Saprospiraceae bacterium]